MPVYPLPLTTTTSSHRAHFSAAEFFRDSPWLNVPAHRKADILVEPLYPRLGLLGGAPENGGGKMSKLAALAAARKKKEGDKSPTPSSGGRSDTAQPSTGEGAPLSLRERLARNDKKTKSSESSPSLQSLSKESRSGQSISPKKSPSEPKTPDLPAKTELGGSVEDVQIKGEDKEPPTSNFRAPPSTFAVTIVGDDTRPMMTEPSHLYTNTLDLIKIYGQDFAEPFDFAGPSPDDVVLNAQSSAKGLAIRRKI